MSIQELSEAYMRADQEWRLARAHAIVEHRGEGSDLVVASMADVETEGLCRSRLEALVAFDAAKLEQEADLVGAVTVGHRAAARGWLAGFGEES